MSEKIKFVFKDEKIVFKFRDVINLGGGSGAAINDNTISTSTTWSSAKINTELSSKAGAYHTHSLSDITDYDATTNNKINTAISNHNSDNIAHSDIRNDLANKVDKPSTATPRNIAVFDANKNVVDSGKSTSDFADATHTHSTSDITDFNTTVDNKISTHNIDANSHADIRNLVSAKPDIDDTTPSTTTVYSSQKTEDLLSQKANTTHTHTKSDIIDFAHSISEHSDVDTTGATSGQVLTFNGSIWIPSATGTDTKKVLNSANDTTEGYLADKIVAGTGVSIQTVNSGGNEQLEISVSNSSSALGKLLASYTFTGGENYVLFDNLNINKRYNQSYLKILISASSSGSTALVKINKLNNTLGLSGISSHRYLRSYSSVSGGGLSYAYVGSILADAGKCLIDANLFLHDGILYGFSENLLSKDAYSGEYRKYAFVFIESSLPLLNSIELGISGNIDAGGEIYLYEVPLQ